MFEQIDILRQELQIRTGHINLTNRARTIGLLAHHFQQFSTQACVEWFNRLGDFSDQAELSAFFWKTCPERAYMLTAETETQIKLKLKEVGTCRSKLRNLCFSSMRASFFSHLLNRPITSTNDLDNGELVCIARWIRGQHPKPSVHIQPEIQEKNRLIRLEEVSAYISHNQDHIADGIDGLMQL